MCGGHGAGGTAAGSAAVSILQRGKLKRCDTHRRMNTEETQEQGHGTAGPETGAAMSQARRGSEERGEAGPQRPPATRPSSPGAAEKVAECPALRPPPVARAGAL